MGKEMVADVAEKVGSRFGTSEADVEVSMSKSSLWKK
jgi:hypothetical protein